MMASVGHGGLKEGQVVNKLQEEYEKKRKAEITDSDVLEALPEATQERMRGGSGKSKSGIVVKGIHDVAVRFSKCCSPVPGDEIVGFVTRGRGISVHRTDCVNIMTLPAEERARLIDAEWQKTEQITDTYSAEINLYADNRTGLLVDVSRVLTEANIDVRNMNCRVNKKNRATLSLGFDIHSKEELQRIIEKLRNVEGVEDIERTSG